MVCTCAWACRGKKLTLCVSIISHVTFWDRLSQWTLGFTDWSRQVSQWTLVSPPIISSFNVGVTDVYYHGQLLCILGALNLGAPAFFKCLPTVLSPQSLINIFTAYLIQPIIKIPFQEGFLTMPVHWTQSVSFIYLPIYILGLSQVSQSAYLHFCFIIWFRI